MGFDNYEFDPATDNNSEEHADFAAIGDSVNEDKIKQSVLKRLFHHYPSTMNHSTPGDHTMVCYDTANTLIIASSLFFNLFNLFSTNCMYKISGCGATAISRAGRA